jgi:hypothetical protein
MKKLLIFLFTGLAYTAFSQNVDETAYQRYINVEQYGQLVPGYYLQGNKKVEAQIKYQQPLEFQDEAVPFIIDKGKGEETLAKSKIHAISFDGHVFVPEDLGDSVVWVMVSREGAIRESVYFIPEPANNPRYYQVNHLITNTLTHEGHFVGSLAVNFNKLMASLTAENEEISAKIGARQQGYRFIDYQKIIAEFNLWFQEAYPKKIKYVGEVPDFQALIDNDLSKYLPKK